MLIKSAKALRLDDLYKMVAHIYSGQNIARTSTATFAHFVEVCGMLTLHDRPKKEKVLMSLRRSAKRWVGTFRSWPKCAYAALKSLFFVNFRACVPIAESARTRTDLANLLKEPRRRLIIPP